MTWFKVDDSFYDHPKVFDSSDAAIALWTRAGSWSARNLTDGFVPSGMLARLSGSGETAAEELVDRRLWKRTKGGFRFHDWSAYQPLRSRVERERKQAADRQQKYRESKGAKSRKRSPDPQTSRRDSHRDSRITNTVSNAVSHTTPTRPSSSNEEERVGDRPALRTGAVGPDPPDNPDWRTLPPPGQLTDEQRQRNTTRRNELRSTHTPRHSADDADTSATGS